MDRRSARMLRRLLMPLIGGAIAAWGARRARGAGDAQAGRRIGPERRRARQGLRLLRRIGRF